MVARTTIGLSGARKRCDGDPGVLWSNGKPEVAGIQPQSDPGCAPAECRAGTQTELPAAYGIEERQIDWLWGRDVDAGVETISAKAVRPTR